MVIEEKKLFNDDTNENVIYEEIEKRYITNYATEHSPKVIRTASFTKKPTAANEDDSDSFDNKDDPQNSIYEEMHGLGDDLLESYHIQNVHCRQSSDSLLMKMIRDDSECIYSTVQCHRRNESRSSSSEGSTTGCYNVNNERATVSRSAEDIRQSHPLQDYDRETIYSEIVTNADSTEITAGRITRESANPILRQNRISNIYNEEHQRAASLQNIHINGLYTDSFSSGGGINHSLLSSQTSVEEDLYENSRPSSSLSTNTNSLNKKQHHTSAYCIGEISHHHGYNRQVQISAKSDRKHRQRLARSMESVALVYENIVEKDFGGVDEDYKHQNNGHQRDDIYEKVYDNPAGWDLTRERSSSKPINILQRRTDQDISQVAPFSTSSMSSSMTSSPRGSICSSISSEQTTSMSPPQQPPLLPLSRKRQTGTSSWKDMSAFHGLNYFSANYLGKHCVSKLTHDCIDSSISYVAQRTSLLEMKPVVMEVTHDLIRIGTNQFPWDLIESFAIEEVVNFEIITKNVPFIGIIAGKAGEEAACYVLQSDKATEITDAIRDVFQTASKKKLEKSKSSPEISIQPEFHRFHYLVKVGCTKVRRSLRCVNEYIKLVLEKVNPKDFRSISLEVLGSNVIITDSQSQEESSHSTPSILSLGVFSGDKRYFGYIINELTGAGSNHKQRVQCHVYRAARNSTAANIIDAVSASYQSAYSPRFENCDLNPIYQPTYVSGGRRYTTDSSSTSGRAKSPDTPVTNPIYSPGYSLRTNGNYEANGRNSIVSIASTATNASNDSLNLSLNSLSAESSPSSTLNNTSKQKKKNNKRTQNSIHYSLVERLNSLQVGGHHHRHRHSMNVECLSEEQKDFLIDVGDDVDNNTPASQQPSPRTSNEGEQQNNKIKSSDSIKGSTETLLTLTPSSPSSPCSLPRSSPVTNKKDQRPKSLHLYTTNNDPFPAQNDLEGSLTRCNTQHKSPKHKKLFNKVYGSIRGRIYTPDTTPQNDTPSTPSKVGTFQFVERPISFDEDDIISTTYNFKITYLCSSLVKAPLRPKHVRECYKQFTKEMQKSEKVSNNCRLKTIGSPVELVIVTDTEVIMLDPANRSNVIRQCSIGLFEECVLHPDDTMGCFAFSTNVPGTSNSNHHKIHCFTMPVNLKDNILSAFAELKHNKKRHAAPANSSPLARRRMSEGNLV